MERLSDNKIIAVTQKTRLENLIARYNTQGQAKFYIESHGGDFSDYLTEHETYKKAVSASLAVLCQFGRVTAVEREYIPNFIFGENDLVVVIGRDGLMVNVLKYLTTQKLIGVNPDPKRWDGILLPFSCNDLNKIVPETFKDIRPVKSVTLAYCKLSDGQIIYGVNDLFIGQKTHASARYKLSLEGRTEMQSSSGIIVSTGLGRTGWLKSIIAGAQGIGRFCGKEPEISISNDFSWNSDYLYFTVREPFPSTSTGTDIVFGKINKNSDMIIESCMPENGFIFSDGIENDCLEFNSGTTASIGVSDRTGNLIM